MSRVLVIGASGQIGTELVEKLREAHGASNVVAADIKTAAYEVVNGGPFEQLDVLDTQKLYSIIHKYHIDEVYLLAALLSAKSEEKLLSAWRLNMDGLMNILEIARGKYIHKVFWPSSIAVFGPTTPKENTPQHAITEPNTIYGISKLAGERWCEYYHAKFGVDVRSLRYPGLIGYRSEPGGGTTDYAVQIFHDAIHKGEFECFLEPDTVLPMMYMPDALAATLDIMNAPAEKVRLRSSYNLSAFSFSPAQLAREIKKHVPDFKITYNPDHRQKIAESWPASIDSSVASQDWGWKPQYDLTAMTDDMFAHLKVSQES